MHPYHLSREVKIERFVARPETSCENSHCQVNPWICIRSIAEIFLKAGLIFSSQRQISYLDYFERGKEKIKKINRKIVLLTQTTVRSNVILTIPSIFEVNWPPHCCFNFVKILLSCSSLALLSNKRRLASFFLLRKSSKKSKEMKWYLKLRNNNQSL